MVQVKLEKGIMGQKQTQLLVIGVFEGEQDFPHSKDLDPTIFTSIKESLQNKEFRAIFGSSLLVYTLGKGPMKKILLLGLGKREKFTYESARISAGKAAQKARELSLEEFSILPFSNIDEDLIEAMAEGIALALYSFDKYRESQEPATKIEKVSILIDSDSPRFQSVADKANIIVDAVNFARDIGNMPPNDCSPAYLGSVAISLAQDYGMKVRIMDRYELEDRKSVV